MSQQSPSIAWENTENATRGARFGSNDLRTSLTMPRTDLLTILIGISLTGCRSLLLYPNNSLFQVTTGVSVPVELNLKDRKMVFSIGYQLNFKLPWNVTQFEPTVISARKTRDLTLQDTYATIEDLLENNGWEGGRECLLRSICELAEVPLERSGQDLVEEVIHLLLTPSGDLPEAIDTSHRSVDKLYQEAELLGRSGGDCILAYPDCIKSPLEYFTEIAYSEERFNYCEE